MTLHHKILPFSMSSTWYQVCTTVSLWSEKMNCSENVLQLTLRTNSVTSMLCPCPSILIGLENFQGLSLTFNPSPEPQCLYFLCYFCIKLSSKMAMIYLFLLWVLQMPPPSPSSGCSRHPEFLLSSWCLVTRQILVSWIQLSLNITISLFLEDK